MSEKLNPRELFADYWREDAQRAIHERLQEREQLGAAKNVILFVGDGMSLATQAGARALLGQREGRTGEEAALSFEAFPVVGLAKVNRPPVPRQALAPHPHFTAALAHRRTA